MIDLSDPISRQQTIAALRALSDEYGYINVPHEVVTDVVRGLPPVRAEQGQTVHSERGETDKLGVKTGETCEDCISRQAAIDALDCVNGTEEVLRSLPSAQPKRKKGEWITQEFGTRAECSECHELYDIPIAYSNFCLNCGADMREGQDGER